MDTPGSPSEEPHPNEQTQNAFVANFLIPGSSLHPTFLLILDLAFGLLALVFLALFYLSGWSIHLLVLMAIEGCLYASIKW